MSRCMSTAKTISTVLFSTGAGGTRFRLHAKLPRIRCTQYTTSLTTMRYEMHQFSASWANSSANLIPPHTRREPTFNQNVCNTPSSQIVNFMKKNPDISKLASEHVYLQAVLASVPAITDSVNKCSVFGGHFNPNSLAHTLT